VALLFVAFAVFFYVRRRRKVHGDNGGLRSLRSYGSKLNVWRPPSTAAATEKDVGYSTHTTPATTQSALPSPPMARIMNEETISPRMTEDGGRLSESGTLFSTTVPNSNNVVVIHSSSSSNDNGGESLPCFMITTTSSSPDDNYTAVGYGDMMEPGDSSKRATSVVVNVILPSPPVPNRHQPRRSRPVSKPLQVDFSSKIPPDATTAMTLHSHKQSLPVLINEDLYGSSPAPYAGPLPTPAVLIRLDGDMMPVNSTLSGMRKRRFEGLSAVEQEDLCMQLNSPPFSNSASDTF